MPFFIAGGVALALSLPVILILGILVILALRHDDDPDGNRAPAIYGSVIAFLAILTILFAATGIVSELVATTSGSTHGTSGARRMEMNFTPNSGSSLDDNGLQPMPRFAAYHEDHDGRAITNAVGFLIAGLAAAGLLALHRGLFAHRRTVTGAAARVHRAYLLVMCLILVVLGLTGAAVAVYAVFRAIASDWANVRNRADELRAAGSALALALGAGYLWRRHWDELGLDLGGPEPPPAVTATDVP